MKLNPDLREQIDAARAQSQSTRRATVPALEELLYEPLPCLDHGFVRCIDYMVTTPPSSRPPGSATARAPRPCARIAA